MLKCRSLADQQRQDPLDTCSTMAPGKRTLALMMFFVQYQLHALVLASQVHLKDDSFDDNREKATRITYNL